MIDHDDLYNTIIQRRAQWEADRLKPTEILLRDGDMNLRGAVAGELSHEFEFVENDTGVAQLVLPVDHYLAKWVTNFRGRAKKNVHIQFNRQGAQWDGRMDDYKLRRDKNGAQLVITFKHCYEELKHIYCWANPFLPAEFQFPKIWMMFGPAKWALSVTLLANLVRKEASLWMFPEDPAQMLNLNTATWDIVLKPFSFSSDNSTISTVLSRFKNFHDASKRAVADGELSIECRRWYTGDPLPWPGAQLKNGAMVVDIVDKSGWRTETSFGGNLLTGLERAYISIAGDGMTEGINVISGSPTFPGEYYQPGWRGTRPQAPHVVFEDGMWSGIEESEFCYYPATDVQFVTGGQSMNGINEGISAAVIALGGFIGSFFGQSQIGPAIDAVAKPLYENTIMAFQAWKDVGRANSLGDFHYFERWCDSNRAYTIAAIIALRTGMFATREHTAHTLKVSDAAPYRFGPPGSGDCWLSDRVASSVLGQPENELYVDRITKIKHSSDTNGPKGWDVTIGWREPEDPLLHAYGLIRELTAGFQELGI